jgi:enterochelin esterase-like enzyme
VRYNCAMGPCLAVLSLFVQASGAGASGPAALPIVSPEVAVDGRVTFRLRAPVAKEVLLTGTFGKDKLRLARDEQGIWTAVVGPIPPGVYEYSFWVDGFRTLDPVNPRAKPQRTLSASVLEIGARSPLPSELTAVAHGTVHWHEYRSRALGGQERRFHVYTPPGYEKKAGARYPVLYLLHGLHETDEAWTGFGRGHHMLDNLIAQGRARPMVVVMPDGNPVPLDGDRPPERVREALLAFERDLLDEVVPLAESLYRIRPGAANRAIAGLSSGGQRALYVGLHHPEKFSWIGSYSSATPRELIEPVLADAGVLNRKLRWVWIGCGKDDPLFKRVSDFSAWLDEKGLHHIFRPGEGGHAWPTWRQQFLETIPQLFAPVGKPRG